MAETPSTDSVGFWFDPVCPYSWTASRWLHEVGERRTLRVQHHLMSLFLLNEHRTDVAADYRRTVETTRGPSRVASVVATRYGEDVLGDFYTAFGRWVFDRWRRPTSAEYHDAVRASLAELGLPADLEDTMESEDHDEDLRRSHDTGVAAVGGGDVGTPIVDIDGVAFFGPVLNSIPRGDVAVRVFDGVRLLAGCPPFHELKRSRQSPPLLT
jgi:2-hydroxychromene-2-carboxylate isomerase